MPPRASQPTPAPEAPSQAIVTIIKDILEQEPPNARHHHARLMRLRFHPDRNPEQAIQALFRPAVNYLTSILNT